jgi:hypothetical protein
VAYDFGDVPIGYNFKNSDANQNVKAKNNNNCPEKR